MISTVVGVTPPPRRVGPKSGILRVSVSPAEVRAGARVLLVDDQPEVRRICRFAIQSEVGPIGEVGSGPEALAELAANVYDLVLLDIDLPGQSGDEVLLALRSVPPSPNLKVIMLSGRANGDDLAAHLANGADDFLTKPFSLVQLRARVKAALRLKEAQDRADLMTARVRAVNGELERALSAKDGELLNARAAMVLALAKLVEQRSSETGPHLFRMRKYCRVLADAAALRPGFAGQIDPAFVTLLEDAAPLHDIGKVGVPDHVINKPGPLTSPERRQMQAHTTIGADTLADVARQHPFALGFLQIAADIARHHHERWDGTGYPARLVGESIPLAARMLALADVYDAMRSRRVYKAPMTHADATRFILEQSPGHFDPALSDVFREVAASFEAVYRDNRE